MRGTVAVVAAVAAALVGMAQPASAIQTDPDPSSNPCIANSTFLLTVSRTSAAFGQSVVVNSSMSLAPGCSILPADTFLQFVDPQSGMSYTQPVTNPLQATVIPPGTGYYNLAVINDGQTYQVGASAPVTVTYPSVGGHPFARITSNIPDEAVTLEKAVQQPNARVYIAGDVNLDVTGMDGIHVAPGVQMIGERSEAYPDGPRVFTRTLPAQLFDIGTFAPAAPSDNVRVTGIRFDGGEPSDPCASAGLPHDQDAFEIYNSVGVEIDHDEFYSWNGSAVSVKKDEDDSATDPVADRLTPTIGKAGVWVYDNYIHDNQHPTVCSSTDPLVADGHGAGYGVDNTYGGYSYIQGNVFSSNRHSIAGDGRNGSGYVLTGNLFISPGVDDVKIITSYNHQIDMHGTGTCPDVSSEHYNCGQGGLYMEVENNIVAGNTAAAIQLRGQPTNVTTPTPGVSNSDGMYVHDNVFNDSTSNALTETVSSNGLVIGSGNVFNTTTALQESFLQEFTDPGIVGPFCDFDGDGTPDAFRDTAGVFWYYSSLFGRWMYMTTNNVPATGLTFGDVNGDGLCDVSNASGVLYETPPPFEAFPLLATVPNLNGLAQSAAVDAIATADLQFGTVTTVPSLSPVGTVLGQSLTAGSSVQAGSILSLTVSGGGVALPNLTGMTEANARATLGSVGLVVGNVSHDNNAAPAGTVYTESPAPGSGVVVSPGSTVNFGVSLGPLRVVPNLKGDTDSQARAAITGAGLTVGTAGTTPNCVDPGTVQVQDPSAGVQVSQGTTVTYSISTCSGGGGGGGGGGGTGGGGGGGGGKPPIQPK